FKREELPTMSLNYYTVDALPVSGEQITLCFSGDKKLAWLELTNFDYLMTKSRSHKIVTVLVGAMPVPTRTWKAPPGLTRLGPPVPVEEVTWDFIDKAKADASRPQRVPIEAGLEPEQILKFQSAIVEHWKGFSRSRISEYAKGTSIRKSITSPS